MKTFFIAGVQRSGTTLLSVMLGNHPDILMERRSIAFRMITCFRNMIDLLPHNLDVGQKEFTEWLIENDHHGRLAKLINTNNLNNTESIRELIRISIKQKLNQNNKQIWADKSPNLEHYTNDLFLLIPNTKIIHIIRDGRATAWSMKKRAHTNLELAAQNWVNGNIHGLVNQQVIGSANYKIVFYEDLVNRPEIVLKSICEFLDIPFYANLINPLDKELIGQEKYVPEALEKTKINDWKNHLNESDILKIERIQGPLLKRLGYEQLIDEKKIQYRSLSNRRRIWLTQKDNFKRLFVSEKEVMVNKALMPLKISIKNRVFDFCRVLAKDFLPREIFKSIFSRLFYKEKIYKPVNKSKNEEITL